MRSGRRRHGASVLRILRAAYVHFRGLSTADFHILGKNLTVR
jgi:hypothetical protein